MKDKKPISKSVEMKLKKLRERLAKKENQERLAAEYKIPPRVPQKASGLTQQS